MRSKTLVTLVSAAGLLLALGLTVADAPVARAAAAGQAVAERDVPGPAPLYVPSSQTFTAAERATFLHSIQPKVGSGLVALKMAKSLGITTVQGKTLNVNRRKVHPTGVRLDFETPVAANYYGNENEPSIAASPIDERIVVAVSHDDSSGNNECQADVSFDGGITFDVLYNLPLTTAGDFCSDPVVRVTPYPSGYYFVFSYLSVRSDASTTDVVTLVADGLTPSMQWTGATIVVTGGADFPDKEWIGVHTFDNADGTNDGQNFVYLTNTLFTAGGDCDILFSKSTDYGFTWSAPVILAQGLGCNPVYQGSRPAAGPGTDVLVCYFDSGTDGFNIDALSGGKFNETCKSSKDRGATWSATIFASKDIVYELPRFLSPSSSYHRIWGSMFPSLDIDHLGNAHLVFSADPTVSKTDSECGNVYYIKSIYPNGSVVGAPAYDKWLARSVVGSLGTRFQGWGTVVAQRTNTQVKPFVYVAYADHARGDVTKPNLVYDVKYRKSSVGGGSFGAPVLVTTQSSLSQYYFIGDYFDSATTQRRYHVIWTDRADKTSIYDYECDVFAHRY